MIARYLKSLSVEANRRIERRNRKKRFNHCLPMVDTVLQHSVVAPLVIRPFFYGHLADFYDIAIPLLQLYLGPVMRFDASRFDSRFMDYLYRHEGINL